MTGGTKNRSRHKDVAGGKTRRETKLEEKLDAALERGLEDSFPGSDPVAVTQPPHTASDKSEA